VSPIFQISATKLFLELDQYELAADVISIFLEENDEDPEALYLHSFAASFFDLELAEESLEKAKHVLTPFISVFFFLMDYRF